AQELAAVSPNFVIKVGASEAGFRAIRELNRQGIRTNATLIFTAAQAWQAARAGASFVSPFLGWKEQYGDAAASLIREVRTVLDNFNYPQQIIAAAIRNARQIAEAAIAGAHCITARFAVYEESCRNPYTRMGEEIFQKAWDATPER
ncbi:MAG TPA: transaldolase, partial [Planctomycetaceae bacterium]|nr:transaldolase [Planctomycetaceae bacterium]